MINRIWCFMVIFGIVFTGISGKTEDISLVMLSGAEDAVDLFIVMAGAVSLWSGIMKIAEKSGGVDFISRKMMPILRWLFPSVPQGHKAMKYISLNMAANILGLGWAATPSGIMAVKELNNLNGKKEFPSKAISMFMVINMSSIQLVSINIISYRMKYSSANPAEIVLPGIIATAVSTVSAVWLCKIYEGRNR